ncbi:MAG: hypothetical protein ISS77_01950 [Phycisphaerae bacterium]|nr:hypothetical protein [Phycisphaerae bacterium]
MIKKSGNIFEQHIEKMVLVVAGLLSMWVLISRVVISPNQVEYGNKTYKAGELDNKILEDAQQVVLRLEEPAEEKGAYQGRADEFMSVFCNPLQSIDESLYPIKPGPMLLNLSVKNRYSVPAEVAISDVAVEHLRAAAYFPAETVDIENAYDQVETEVNDLDIVTVEASIDAENLIESFYESFAGPEVKPEWRDPCLAKPLFAAVELYRQEELADGQWSNWQIVPRSQIECYKEMFNTIENVSDLPAGGMKVRLMRFSDLEVQKAIIQPECYKIASAEEEWFPPRLHDKFLVQESTRRRKEKLEKREEETAAREDEKSKLREERSNRRDKKSAPSPTTSGGDMMDMFMMMEMGGGGAASAPTKKRSTRGSSDRAKQRAEMEKEKMSGIKERLDSKLEDDVYDEFKEMLLDKNKDLSEFEDGLVFWANDDTVEPKKTYRYKIRLGVFNPIAGTNQFVSSDTDWKDRVIIWSNYSEVSDEVEIPARLYMFPLSVKEASNSINVAIAKYKFGYWYLRDFTVKPGDLIGKVTELEDADIEPEEGIAGELTLPESIDYGTGAVYLDAVAGNVWTGNRNMQQRYLYQMLYSYDGADIEKMPVKQMFWDSETVAVYSDIKRSLREDKKPFAELDERRGRGGRKGGLGGMPSGAESMDDYMMQEQMMFQQMMMGN